MGSIRPIMRVATTVVSLVTVLALTSCGLPGASSPASTLTQGGDFPSLHRLNWGFAYVDRFAWSPDGQWIAMLAGDDYATSHLEVMSPDGRKRYDLTDWECGTTPTTYSFSWLSDRTLICASNTDEIISGAPPFSAPSRNRMAPRLHPYDSGMTATSQKDTLIVASQTSPSAPINITTSQLYEVTVDGDVSSQPLTTQRNNVSSPVWQPKGTALTYLVEESRTTGGFDLYRSTVSQTASGLKLGPGFMLAQGVDQYYSWSPTGHWLVVRQPGYSGGDRIYLINPDNPTQTVDVVLGDLAGQQMTDPVWSPDGKTLIVTSVGISMSYPYSLDIGSYLRSKGLQP